MRSPFSAPYLLAFIFALILLTALVHVGIIRVAFEKLGLEPESAILLLFTSLLGSLINLPLFSVRSEAPPEDLQKILRGLLHVPRIPFTGRTRIAVNVGGGLVPALFSVYLVGNLNIPLGQVFVGITSVAAVCYLFSRPIRGFGIGIPILVAPVSAALVALLINPEQSAPLAYVAGTMGVLIGADILRLPDVRYLGAPIAAIGGAGTFDGVFLTGIVAVLLA